MNADGFEMVEKFYILCKYRTLNAMIKERLTAFLKK
jgi:hypothetical protein